MRIISLFILLYSLAFQICLIASQRFEGNGATTTFNFPLEALAFAPNQGRLLVGAKQEVPGNEYSLACAGFVFDGKSLPSFGALGINQVILNGKEKQPNPLTGAAMKHLCFMENYPVAVTKAAPAKFCLIDEYSGLHDKKHHKITITTMRMYETPVIRDADQQASSEILGIAAADPYVFACVRPHDQALADTALDIALAYFYNREPAAVDKKVKHPKLNLLNAATGAIGENKAVRLDAQNSNIRIGSPVVSLGSHQVPLLWHEPVKRLYVPLDVVGGDDERDGARALVVGCVKNRMLEFYPIAPVDALSDNGIIGARGSAVRVAIHGAQSMRTTTGLPYLIVVGGVGPDDAIAYRVSALPLVESAEEHLTGTIAKKDQLPVDFYDSQEPFTFISRAFTEPATKPEHMPCPADPEVQVGQGGLPGQVIQLTVQGDAVFALVEGQAGIFHSQALFDPEGKVSQWTRWQPALRTDKLLAGFALEPISGSFWQMRHGDDGQAYDILRSQWDTMNRQDENFPLAKRVSRLFDQVPSQVQDLRVYSSITPGFSTVAETQLSLLVATGFRRVVLVETGNDRHGLLEPIREFNGLFESGKGSLAGFREGVDSISLTGGVLNELGPIVASTIVTNREYGWLVVAGSGGVAVLANPDGTGWSAQAGLRSGFSGFSQRMKFIKLGTYEHVHTVCADQGKLIIITPTACAVIELTPETVRSGKRAKGRTVVRPKELGEHTYFLDALVSDGIVLLATDAGLFYSRKACDYDIKNTDWKEVRIPSSAGAVTRMFALGPSGYAFDAAFGGNVYLVSGSASNDQARIYRYFFDKDAREPLVLLPDNFTHKAGRSFFLNIGFYRSFFATDGAVAFLTGSSFVREEPAVEVLRLDAETHGELYFNKAHTVLNLKGATSIGQVVREPVSGVWLAWGDFGARGHA